jgi:hypothetical protein
LWCFVLSFLFVVIFFFVFFEFLGEQVQSAINHFGIDFTDNGIVDYHDRDHVNVTRDGDGTAEWGYGFVHTLRFAGRQNYRGLSTALGPQEPLRVVAVGSAGGCADPRPTSSMRLKLAVRTNSSDGSPFLFPEGNSDARGALRPGATIRIEGSADPWHVYTVAAIDGRQVRRAPPKKAVAGCTNTPSHTRTSVTSIVPKTKQKMNNTHNLMRREFTSP